MNGEVNDAYLPDDDNDEKNLIPDENGKTTVLSLDEATPFEKEKGKSSSAEIRAEETCQEEKEPEVKPEEELPPVGFFSLFRYASCCDLFLIGIATVVAVAAGTANPAMVIIFGQIMDQFIGFNATAANEMENAGNFTSNDTISKEEFLSVTARLFIYNTTVAVGYLLSNYVIVSFFSVAAANQAFRIRCRFMQAVLRQDMAWFDTHKTGDFASRITGDLSHIQEGVGDKVGICIQFVSSTLLCVGTGIYYGWKLALVILCLTPVLTAATAIMSKIQANVTTQEMEAYGNAGAVAEEVLSSIRTVVAFGGQEKEIQRYKTCLVPASRKAIKRGLMTGIGSAITWVCFFGGYALAFWYGVQLIVESRGQHDPEYTGGKLIIVFFTVLTASMSIGQTAPYFEAFNVARGAAAKIFSIIDREPIIDSSSDLGLQPLSLEGHIQLKDVHFNYPSRPTVPVLTGLDLKVKPGETVALVGASGCGKSTIVQLLLRFYDTNSGSVELDGINVKELNLGWLRDHIGLVGQEPVLFSTSIEENIRMGRKNATMEEIVQAAKTANAHNFIEGLPKKYQTPVGERGTQLSGGQKQRIAIARALVRNPRILLLDEATSALDTESEAVVQAALDEARRGRTTVIVAHRLSTIRTADKIAVLEGGVVKETGTHEELMEAKGVYYNLVVTQTTEEDKEDSDTEALTEFERRTSILSSGSGDGSFRPGMIRQMSRQFSTTSVKGGDVQAEKDEDVDTSSLRQTRLLKLIAPDWLYILIGGVSSVLMGMHFPVYGIVFGNIFGLMSQPTDVIQEKNRFFCLIFAVMAISAGVFNFLQIFMFSIAGENLTFRLRNMVFTNIISQDIGFFDENKNSVGSLCSRLNSDASSVQGATGSRISTLLQSLSTMAICIFIGLFYNWKIGLLVLSFVPVVLVAAALEAKVIRGHMHNEKKGMEDASKAATEAIESIRTVASLHQEETFYIKYRDALLEPHLKSRTRSHVRGLSYGFGQCLIFFAYAAALYYGSILVARAELPYADMLKIMEGILAGAQMIGQATAFTPDYEKARVSAVRIFRLLEIHPVIDSFSIYGLQKHSVTGMVDFSNVYFSYPNRPEVKVLRGLNMAIKPGQTVALVGSSGCGKSTCVQLLERFYDPTSGTVMVDSNDLTDLNVSNHRSHMALVSQEPVLFGRTIAENIAYGDNSRQPDMSEIISVARQANIHGFVSALPQGYDTPVGSKGTQLSGGQKQRIAIARALIRNPRILLLDEATSALDAESEKVVQEALDEARSGRTCLVIAHRLTTVQNADLILVLHRGKIVEKGTHQELINKKGFYYRLHNTQGQNG